MSHTYAIADLHGRYDLLNLALELIQQLEGPNHARLVVLGDFVDRGPQSRQIIERLMAGPPVGWTWTVLQGNHEDIMLQALANLLKMNWWLGNGGGQTLLSYGHAPAGPIIPSVVPPKHTTWLMQLPVAVDDDHRVYVHAGVDCDLPMAEQNRNTMQWGLYTSEFRDSTQLVDLPHMSGKHIVHGHHQSASHPLLLPWRTNLDAFAWHTGELAIAVFDDAIAGGPIDILWVKV